MYFDPCTICSIIRRYAVGGYNFGRVPVRFETCIQRSASRLSSFLFSYRTFSERVPARSSPDSFIRDVNTAVGIRADIRDRASVRAVSTYPCIIRLYVTRSSASPQRF